MLNDEELNELLIKYENEIKMQLVMQQENIRRGTLSPKRSARENILWNMIEENILSSYRNELSWVRETRQKLVEDQIRKVKDKMNYQIIEIDNKKYIELISSSQPLSTENDALDLVALCGEHKPI